MNAVAAAARPGRPRRVRPGSRAPGPGRAGQQTRRRGRGARTQRERRPTASAAADERVAAAGHHRRPEQACIAWSPAERREPAQPPASRRRRSRAGRRRADRRAGERRRRGCCWSAGPRAGRCRRRTSRRWPARAPKPERVRRPAGRTRGCRARPARRHDGGEHRRRAAAAVTGAYRPTGAAREQLVAAGLLLGAGVPAHDHEHAHEADADGVRRRPPWPGRPGRRGVERPRIGPAMRDEGGVALHRARPPVELGLGGVEAVDAARPGVDVEQQRPRLATTGTATGRAAGTRAGTPGAGHRATPLAHRRRSGRRSDAGTAPRAWAAGWSGTGRHRSAAPRARRSSRVVSTSSWTPVPVDRTSWTPGSAVEAVGHRRRARP